MEACDCGIVIVEQFFYILQHALARDISFKLVIAGEAKELSFVEINLFNRNTLFSRNQVSNIQAFIIFSQVSLRLTFKINRVLLSFGLPSIVVTMAKR